MTELDLPAKGIDTFIKNAKTAALVSYVATFRALRINKQNAIKCMLELDRRRQDGDDTPYEELIDSEATIIKSVGKGIIVRVDPIDINNILIQMHSLKIDAVIYNKDRGLIHIGKASQEIQAQIISIPGVQKIESDKSVLKNAPSSKILDVGKDSR